MDFNNYYKTSIEEQFGKGITLKALENDFGGENGPTTAKANLGTSIMAVKFDGGVVLGADSRTSMGSYVSNRVTDKLTPVHDHIYCCRSGSAADTQIISDYVRYYLDNHALELGEAPSVKTAAAIFQQMCYTNKNNLMAGIICAGWDKQNKGSVWSIPLGGAMVEQDYAIGGSGSTYIYGFCDSAFKRGMSRSECEEFVKHALSLAMHRDGSSGGLIRLAIIDEKGVERKIIPGNHLPQLYVSESVSASSLKQGKEEKI